jgi:hypothetical protein
MAGGKPLFFEVFLMNLDSNIGQTVINSSTADLKAGLMFFSLPGCSRAFVMAASISISCQVIALTPPCPFYLITKFVSSETG